MQNTTNYDLKIYEGDDLFNPLTVENQNTQAIDGFMKENEDAGVQTATELLSGTIHAITRSKPDASVFRFTAVSRFTAGDTFTVDGVQVSALLTSGEQLPDGAYVIGAEVMGCLKGQILTLYVSTSSVETARNSLKLNGQEADYYATKQEVDNAQQTATSAGNLASEANNAIGQINQKLGTLGSYNVVFDSGIVPNTTTQPSYDWECTESGLYELISLCRTSNVNTTADAGITVYYGNNAKAIDLSNSTSARIYANCTANGVFWINQGEHVRFSTVVGTNNAGVHRYMANKLI